jgi:hypothetical protein
MNGADSADDRRFLSKVHALLAHLRRSNVPWDANPVVPLLRRSTTGYRRRILSTPEGLRRDIIYHLEPWQLAQRLAGAGDRELTAAEQTWYEKIVQASTAEAAVVGTEDEVREFQNV